MKRFAAVLAVLAAAEDTIDAQEENASPETFLLTNSMNTLTGSTFNDNSRLHSPLSAIPPYPAPTKGRGPALELVQVTTKPVDGILRSKTKSKSGPAIPLERSALECVCPETFTLFGDRCERIVEGPQETLCPQGTELLNNICIRTIRPEERCPYGFATVNNRCVRREVTVPQMTCADGYTLEASAGLTKHDPTLVCVKQFGVDNILECPDGSRYNGSCFSYENVPAEFTCSPGYEDLGNATCRRVAEVPCSTEKEPTKGVKTLAFPAHGAKRSLAEEENAVMTRIPVQHDSPLRSIPLPGVLRGKAEVIPPARNKGELAGYGKWHNTGPKDHPVNFEIIDVEQTCVANITIPSTPYCPVGDLRGRLCQVPIHVAPVEVCPAYGNPSNCFAFDRLNPFATCPAGFNQECAILKHHVDSYVDCECIRIHERAIDLFCPAGYALENGICILRTEPYTGCSGLTRPVNGSCQRTESAQAICSYTVSYACEGQACATTIQHPGQNIGDKPGLALAIKKY